MDKQTDVLARVYSLILSTGWGTGNNKEEADHQVLVGKHGDRLVVTTRGGRPVLEDSISKSKVGSQQPWNSPEIEGSDHIPIPPGGEV